MSNLACFREEEGEDSEKEEDEIAVEPKPVIGETLGTSIAAFSLF